MQFAGRAFRNTTLQSGQWRHASGISSSWFGIPRQPPLFKSHASSPHVTSQQPWRGRIVGMPNRANALPPDKGTWTRTWAWIGRRGPRRRHKGQTPHHGARTPPWISRLFSEDADSASFTSGRTTRSHGPPLRLRPTTAAQVHVRNSAATCARAAVSSREEADQQDTPPLPPKLWRLVAATSSGDGRESPGAKGRGGGVVEPSESPT
jgi:hypothetical protein